VSKPQARREPKASGVEQKEASMPVSEELLEILVCPETKQPVKPAPQELLRKLAADIEAGSVRNRGGDKLTKAPTEGLVREDGKVLYPVDDGIPVMLIEESIELS
jgi:uncharacterized protein YbaR (Trm112 family)